MLLQRAINAGVNYFGLADKTVNKDDRLIRLDYVFSKLAAPGDARKHNQSYQTPRLLFLSFRFPRCYSYLNECVAFWGCTRLRLVYEALKLNLSY